MYQTQKLTEDELLKLSYQYHQLTDELAIYRENMRKRSYRRNYTEHERAKHLSQYRFLVLSIRETVKTLFDHGHYDRKLLKSVIFNRFIDIPTRWSAAVKLYLSKFGFTDSIE